MFGEKFLFFGEEAAPAPAEENRASFPGENADFSVIFGKEDTNRVVGVVNTIDMKEALESVLKTCGPEQDEGKHKLSVVVDRIGNQYETAKTQLQETKELLWASEGRVGDLQGLIDKMRKRLSDTEDEKRHNALKYRAREKTNQQQIRKLTQQCKKLEQQNKMIHRRDKQYQHKMRRMENEIKKLQNTISMNLLDRKKESKLGIVVLNPNESHLQGNAAEAKSSFEEDVISGFKAHLDELVEENSKLREMLKTAQADYLEALDEHNVELKHDNLDINVNVELPIDDMSPNFHKQLSDFASILREKTKELAQRKFEESAVDSLKDMIREQRAIIQQQEDMIERALFSSEAHGMITETADLSMNCDFDDSIYETEA